MRNPLARLLCFALLTAPAASAQPKPAQKPNVLVVTVDTLRADRLGCYGYAQARTPHIDRLAAQGIRFERAYATAPLTLPSHCTVFTGTYPMFHGVRDNSGYVLSDRRHTLAELFKDEGYSTGAFVGAFVLDSKFGLQQGFDRYFDDFDLARFESVSPGYIQRTGDEVVREALSWLAAAPRPFFAWVHLYDPHDPYTPPQPYAARHPNRPYDGEIEFTDHNVGTLLRWLQDNQLYDDTLIALLGDHGESLGEHGEAKHGLFIYDATLRVPWIVRLPGGAGLGRTVAENVSLADFFPTVVQLLKLDRSRATEAQGRGLTGLMLGKGGPQRADLYAESFYPNLQFGWSPLRALVSGQWKYILAPEPELYDLVSDPGETRNLASERSALASRFQENLEGLATRYANRSAEDSAEQRPDAETLAKLQSLGYVALSAGKASAQDYRNLPDPKKQIGLYNRLTDLFGLSAAGKHKETIPGYQRVVKEQPSLKIAWYKLGQAHFFTGDYPAALESFKKAIELGGEDALAVFDLAQTYRRLRRPQDAKAGFQRTVELDPSHYRAMTNLGVIYKNEGNIPQAIAEFERALKIAPNSIQALGNVGVAYSLAGQDEQGVAALRKAIALSPDNALLHANLGAVYRKMGKLEEARRELETARRLNPRLFQRQ